MIGRIKYDTFLRFADPTGQFFQHIPIDLGMDMIHDDGVDLVRGWGVRFGGKLGWQVYDSEELAKAVSANLQVQTLGDAA